MTADRIEVSWDAQRKRWLIRIQVGEEVIRRYCDDPASASADVLRAAAVKTASDEGYQVDDANIVILTPA